MAKEKEKALIVAGCDSEAKEVVKACSKIGQIIAIAFLRDNVVIGLSDLDSIRMQNARDRVLEKEIFAEKIDFEYWQEFEKPEYNNTKFLDYKPITKPVAFNDNFKRMPRNAI